MKQQSMHKLTKEETELLLNEAKNVSNNAHAIYSKYPVGAALLTTDGKIFTGVNIENASFGLTICAERFAVGAAVSHGYKKGEIKGIAIYTPKVGDISPCGTCRQFLFEFEDGEGIRVLFKKNNNIVDKSILELLPYGFNENNLQ